MSRWSGRLITKTPVTPSGPGPTSSAPGVWTLPEVAYWNKQGRWPSASADPYWSYVSYLLGTTSTNAAQNNTFLDSSTNNFTITRAGNTTQGTITPYAPLWSNYLPGAVDNYFSVPNSSAFQFGTGDVTIEAWINLSGNTITNPDGNRSATICSGIGATGVSNDFWFNVTGNSTTTGTGLNFQVFNGGASTVIFNTAYTFNKGAWYHVAFTRSGNNVYLFVNGSLIASSTYSGTITVGSNPLLIGYGQTGSVNYRQPFFGYISNLRIVKGTALYTAAFTAPEAPLTAVSGTSLLTCQSNRFIDNSSNTFAVTPVGTPNANTYSPFILAPPGYSASGNGGSGYFDGSGDYLTAPANSAFQVSGGDFTLETWFYMTALPAANASGSRAAGIFTYSSGFGGGYEFFVDLTNNVIQVSQPGGGNATYSSYTFSLNTWYHVAFSRASGTNRIFVNGVSLALVANAFPNNATGSPTLKIGAGLFSAGYDHYFPGYLVDARIVKGTGVYTANFTPPTAPVTAITNTSLLLNFTNAGIYDAAMQNDMETSGGAQVSTGQAKYGTTSVFFNGSTDWLSMPNNPAHNFGTGDFTVESWVYQASTPGNQNFVSNYNGPSEGWGIRVVSGVPYFMWGDTVIVNGSSAISANTWTHIAVTRSGTTARMFVNGTQVASATDSTDLTGTGTLFVGRLRTATAGFLWNGYLDDLRITKGYARYTANFTPPTAALPVY